MKLKEMKTYLAAHGVKDGTAYSHGGLGGGGIQGIEDIDGVWHSYYSERGSKTVYRAWPTEEDAVAYVLEYAERFARGYKFWSDTASPAALDEARFDWFRHFIRHKLVRAYFFLHGLKDEKDYTLNGLHPKSNRLSEVPGLQFCGKFWYTYYALPREKRAFSSRSTFRDAANWVMEEAKPK